MTTTPTEQRLLPIIPADASEPEPVLTFWPTMDERRGNWPQEGVMLRRLSDNTLMLYYNETLYPARWDRTTSSREPSWDTEASIYTLGQGDNEPSHYALTRFQRYTVAGVPEEERTFTVEVNLSEQDRQRLEASALIYSGLVGDESAVASVDSDVRSDVIRPWNEALNQRADTDNMCSTYEGFVEKWNQVVPEPLRMEPRNAKTEEQVEVEVPFTIEGTVRVTVTIEVTHIDADYEDAVEAQVDLDSLVDPSVVRNAVNNGAGDITIETSSFEIV